MCTHRMSRCKSRIIIRFFLWQFKMFFPMIETTAPCGRMNFLLYFEIVFSMAGAYTLTWQSEFYRYFKIFFLMTGACTLMWQIWFMAYIVLISTTSHMKNLIKLIWYCTHVNTFVLLTWSNLNNLDLGKNYNLLRFETEGVSHSPLVNT